MAFSTQKEFFHVPFMNESADNDCKKACVKLKSYDSSIDDRSWAYDESKQSKFLSDLLTCRSSVGKGSYGGSDRDGRADDIRREDNAKVSKGNGVLNGGDDQTGGIGRDGNPKASKGNGILSGGDDRAGGVGRDGNAKISKGDGVLSGGDSLLECANIHLADYQNVMNIKTTLEKQLEVSNDRLNTANEENKKIKEILASKLDSNTAKDFYNKIQKLIAAGKLGKNEENEMLQIYKKMENLYKAYEIIQAENYYLKRLIEKMASRVSLENIKSEPETSTDVSFLQKEVNTLRKECTMLRNMEEDYLRTKQQSNISGITEQDADNIRAIIKERNSLREKCNLLEHKASEAQKVTGQLTSTLNNQSNYINKVEDDLQSMQKYYEDANQNACFTEECLKAQIEELKGELMSAKSQALQAETLSMDVGCLRNEVLKRDLALNEYDCQYKELMAVVNELQAIKLQCLQDNQTQTCKAETDELAFFTSATIEQITKELKRNGSNNTELMAYRLGPKFNATDGDYNKDCCSEMYSLQKKLEDMKKELDDALKRVKDVESENAKLVNDLDDSLKANAQLNQKGEEKMANMLAKIERLDGNIQKNEQDTSKIGKELEGTLDLVNEVSDVQLRNQQLTNAVSAINSRDDQKIIDDLRRQLEEELAKLKKCQQDNNDLIKEAKERENDLQKLKDLNNKLEADKKKLEDEKNPQQADKTKSEGQSKKGDHNITQQDKNINDKNDKAQDNDNIKKTQSLTTFDKTKGGDAFGSPNDFAVDKTSTLGKDKAKGGLGKDIANASLSKNKAKAGFGKDNAAALDEFVNRKSASMKSNLDKGRCFEKELRNLLDEFINECRFCFCRLVNQKSKLSAICYKLYHSGMNTLSFPELGYLHKKIFAAAEQKMPGCLLNMILEDYKEHARSILVRESCEGGGELDLTETDQKCCCCKNEICCNNSDEMIKDKVHKLEKDIEMARKYLFTLKKIPFDTGLPSECDDTTCDVYNDCLTFRAHSPQVVRQKARSSQQVKKLKARIMKHPDHIEYI